MTAHDVTRPADASRRRWPVVLAVVLLVVSLGALALAVTQNRADWLVTGTARDDLAVHPRRPRPRRRPRPARHRRRTRCVVPRHAPAPPPAGGVPASLRGQDVEVVPTSERVVALTFDAGGNASGLESILEHPRRGGCAGHLLPDRPLGRRQPGRRRGDRRRRAPVRQPLGDPPGVHDAVRRRDPRRGARARRRASRPRAAIRARSSASPSATATRARSPRSTTSATCRSAGPSTPWAGRAPAAG